MNVDHCKVFFIDLDNTFYDHQSNQVPPKHIEAVLKLKEKGYKVCTCTGRAMLLIEELDILDCIPWDGHVCGNGAYVYDADLNLLEQNTIEPSAAMDLFHFAKEEGIGVLGLGNVSMATQITPQEQAIVDYFHLQDVTVREPKEDDCYSNMLMPYSETIETHLKEANIDGIEPVYMPHCIDVKRKGISKYNGIQTMMASFGLPVHDYIAFGDSYIDLEMLENATLGVVMENGDPRLKERLDEIAPPCSQGGLYTYCKEHNFID